MLQKELEAGELRWKVYLSAKRKLHSFNPVPRVAIFDEGVSYV